MRKNLNYQCILLLTILVVSGCDLLISNNNFNNFLIPAKETIKGDYGFVNLEGEVVIDFDIDLDDNNTPTIMNEGVSLYYDSERNFKVSFICNKNNEIEIKETDYIQASLFNEGLALVVEDMNGLVYIDKEFNEVLKLDYDIITAGYFIDGLAKFQDKTGKWGFIDKTGKKVIKAKYDYVESFSEGYAVVNVNDDGEKIGIVDKAGNVVIKLKDKYSSFGGFHNTLSTYQEDDEIGYLNIKGEEVIKNDDWSSIESFQNNDYATFQEDFKWGLINMNGETVIKNRYDNPLFFYNGLAPVIDDDGMWGFIDVNRDEIIDYEYDEALPLLGKGAYVKDNKDWVFINKNDQQIGELELSFLNTEWLPSLITHGRPFDVDLVINSQYLAIDEFFSSTIESMFNESSIDEIINISVKDAVDEIKIMAQAYQINATDSLENMLSVNSKKVSSKNLLGQHYSFDNDFSCSLTYYFNDYVAENIIEKIQMAYYIDEKIIGQKPNLSTKLYSFRFYINLNRNAYGKGDYFLEKTLEYFKTKGFSEDANFSDYEPYQKLQMSNEKMWIKYYQSEDTIAIVFDPSSSQ